MSQSINPSELSIASYIAILKLANCDWSAGWLTPYPHPSILTIFFYFFFSYAGIHVSSHPSIDLWDQSSGGRKKKERRSSRLRARGVSLFILAYLAERYVHALESWVQYWTLTWKTERTIYLFKHFDKLFLYKITPSLLNFPRNIWGSWCGFHVILSDEP